ncbi:MAG: efflux RND transporter periplasmic adaptor subunit [Amphiplicatus sp.]
MKLSTSVKTALAILALALGYFVVRTVLSGGGEEAAAQTQPALFSVIAEPVTPSEWRDEVTVSGRTKALRKVEVRAETAGAVAATPGKPGTFVTAGTVLCKLNIDARASSLAEARASLAKADLDYNAALELAKDGFRSDTSVAAMKASRDLAAASVERAKVDLEKTSIVAPFDGVFDERVAEVGDYLKIGDPCGKVIAREPFLIVGAVSEKDVAKISAGDRGVARLATGEEVQGAVRLIAKSADASTRTFEVELEVPNPEGALRDGVTAEFVIHAARRDAHRAPRSALTLDDEGVLGVRTVDKDGIVAFKRVSVLGEDANGVWVAGLEGDVNLITRGQEYVRPGQKVAVTAAEAKG